VAIALSGIQGVPGFLSAIAIGSTISRNILTEGTEVFDGHKLVLVW